MTKTKNVEILDMNVKIDFIDSNIKEFSPELKEKITSAIENGLVVEGINLPVELSIEFVEPEQIRELNKDYRGVDKATDVLSFPIYSLKEEILEQKTDSPILLGDIIINPVRAKEQAEEIGNSQDQEITYLSIHSLLHLLGYDHMNEEDKKLMRTQERAILASLKDSNE